LYDTPLTPSTTLSLHDALPISRERPPGPMADRRRLCASSESGLVWSMNCDSWELAKNSLMTAVIGRALMSWVGVTLSSSKTVIRSEEHTSELQSRENLVCRLLL